MKRINGSFLCFLLFIWFLIVRDTFVTFLFNRWLSCRTRLFFVYFFRFHFNGSFFAVRLSVCISKYQFTLCDRKKFLLTNIRLTTRTKQKVISVSPCETFFLSISTYIHTLLSPPVIVIVVIFNWYILPWVFYTLNHSQYELTCSVTLYYTYFPVCSDQMEYLFFCCCVAYSNAQLTASISLLIVYEKKIKYFCFVWLLMTPNKTVSIFHFASRLMNFCFFSKIIKFSLHSLVYCYSNRKKFPVFSLLFVIHSAGWMEPRCAIRTYMSTMQQ